MERSAKGTGIDYWLGVGKDQRGVFQASARLEVSGILKGNESKINARLIANFRTNGINDPGELAIQFNVPINAMKRRLGIKN